MIDVYQNGSMSWNLRLHFIDKTKISESNIGLVNPVNFYDNLTDALELND